MHSERNRLDITFDIVLLLLRFFHTRRTPDSYYTGQQIRSYFNKNNARKLATFLDSLE